MTTYIILGLYLIFGICLGYIIASWAESFFHQHIGHASPRLRRFWQRHQLFGSFFLSAFYTHHILHHCKTFRKDFVTQFESHEERQRLIDEIPEASRKSIMADLFGLTLKGRSKFFFVAPILPLVPVIYLVFGLWVTLGAIIPMFIVYPMMSKWIHPLIHKAEMNLLGDCNALERWLMNTSYMKAVVRDHFLHHEYVKCNYNLLRGGDYIRNVHREPDDADLFELRRVGIRPFREKLHSSGIFSRI